MRPKSALDECFSVMRARDREKAHRRLRRRRSRGTSNSRARARGGGEGDEKFYERARRPGGWFELHQLKKAVPQKFHNAASRRARGGRAAVADRSASNVRLRARALPSLFRAFPRVSAGGKALLFVPVLSRDPITTGCRVRARLRHW